MHAPDKNGGKRKPVVIFAPATLCVQWQTEMIDKLGLPCVRWETRKKIWVDRDEQEISAAGHEQITRCSCDNSECQETQTQQEKFIPVELAM